MNQRGLVLTVAAGLAAGVAALRWHAPEPVGPPGKAAGAAAVEESIHNVAEPVAAAGNMREAITPPAPPPETKPPSREKTEAVRVSFTDAWRDFWTLAGRQGYQEDSGVKFPEDRMEELLEAYRQCFTEIKKAEELRAPIISDVMDEKLRTGMVEHLISPHDPDLDPKARREAEKILLAARKPRNPHELVIVRGNRENFGIVRINDTDDARLPAINDQLDAIASTYVNRVAVLLASAGRPLPVPVPTTR